MERFVNTIEFFVHHEDVRRGSPGWETRDLDEGLQDDLLRSFARSAKMLARKSPSGVELLPHGHDRIVAERAEHGKPSVTVRGPLGEVVLFMYGRQDQSMVDLDGPSDAVAGVRNASFGI